MPTCGSFSGVTLNEVKDLGRFFADAQNDKFGGVHLYG